MRFKFNRSKSTTSVKPLHNLFSAKTSPLDISKLHFKQDCEIKMKSLLYKIIWDLGLSCFYLSNQEKECSVKKSIENYKGDEEDNLEQNKAWLLAESGGCSGELDSTEPHSLHSSFRFSFCSQVEVETIKANISPSATVLMVNLENGLMDPFVEEVKWKRTESLERSISTLTHTLIRFSYAEIVSASCNFSKGRFLGRGALSSVFRGRIGILRTSVAIKRLHKNDNESSKAFCRELMIASSLHNPHIVPLVGFCIDPEEGFFLVYKCVSGGNLEQYLHGKKKGVKSGPALPWSARYKVAVGIAEAIKYLHNGTDRCIVHRDIKPSNILISSKKSAKLCDFGLATWTPAPSVPFHCKTVKGTFGYLAPEYFQHGKVSDKNDVYAFGVVLLEIITGRMPIELKRGPGEENLVVWAKPLLQQGCTEKLLDPQLKHTKKNFNQIARMVETANACINNEECQRPNADEIIAMLKGGEPNFLGRTKATLAATASEHQPQSHLTKTDIKSHIALAMLEVSGLEDNEHMYCR